MGNDFWIKLPDPIQVYDTIPTIKVHSSAQFKDCAVKAIFKNAWGEAVQTNEFEGGCEKELKTPGKGYFELKVEVLRNNAVIQEKTTDLVVTSPLPHDYFSTPWPNFGVWGGLNRRLRELGGAKWDRQLFFTIFQQNNWHPKAPGLKALSEREKVKLIKCVNVLNPFKKMVPLPRSKWSIAKSKISKMMLERKGLVDVWETQNEPMVGENFFGEMSDVVDIIKLESAVFRKYDRDSPIAGICLNPMAPNQYAQIVNYYKNFKIGRYVDAVMLHPYIPGAQSPELGGLVDVVNKLAFDLKKITNKHIPLYISEIGYSTQPGGEVTELQQAAYLARVVILCRQMKSLVACVWHIGLWNDATSPRELAYGILRHYAKGALTRVPKPAFAAWATVSRQTYNAEFIRELDMPSRTVKAMLFKRNTTPLLICYSLNQNTSTAVKIYVGGETGILTDAFGTSRHIKLHDGILDIVVGECPIYFSGGEMNKLMNRNRYSLKIKPDPLIFSPGEKNVMKIIASPDIVSVDSKLVLETPKGWKWKVVSKSDSERDIEIITSPQVLPGDYQFFIKTFDDNKLKCVKTRTTHVVAPLLFSKLKSSIDNHNPVLSFNVSSQNNKSKSAIMKVMDESGKPLALKRIKSGQQFKLPLYFISYGKRKKYSATIHLEKNDYEWSISLPDLAIISIPEIKMNISDSTSDYPFEKSYRISDGLKSKHLLKKQGIMPAGELGFSWDPEFLYIAADVKDKTHIPAKTPANLWSGDSLQIGMSVEQNEMVKINNDGIQETSYCEIGVALLGAKEASWVWASSNRSLMELHHPCPNLKIHISRCGETTKYRVAIPWKTINVKQPRKGLSINLSVLFNDRDEGGRQWIEWYQGIADGKNPKMYGKAILN